MKRRDFIKIGAGGLAALVVGSKIPGIFDNPAYAAKPVPTSFTLRITDAIKHMVTDQTLIAGTNLTGPNEATCYFWIFTDGSASNPLPPECPGPIIFATSGDRVTITVFNDLDEPHAFSIPRLGVTTGPIPAPINGVPQSGSVTFRVGPAGTYLYYDDLNAPVNRAMGLHGAFIVMPARPAGGKNKFTPYDKPPKRVQQLFNDLGTAPWWPGLAWEEGDPGSGTPAFRQYIWLLHQASPRLFAAVGDNTPITFTTNDGTVFTDANPRDPGVFTAAFLHSAFTSNDPSILPGAPNFEAAHNYVPQFFTVSGQSGHFAHNNPYICPINRVGEPCIIRICNAGLWSHSTHIHANHIYVLSLNNKFEVIPGQVDNSIWVDVYTANPLDTYEWLLPYMRPPDVPNDLGIGRDDLETPLVTKLIGGGAGKTWPPQEELNSYIPFPSLAPPPPGAIDLMGETRTALDQEGNPIDLAVLLSPLCFPMHDHSEPSQVAQGGNYNCGMISGINFTGDRKGAKAGGAVITFDMAPPEHGPDMEPKNSGLLPPTVPFKAPSIP